MIIKNNPEQVSTDQKTVAWKKGKRIDGRNGTIRIRLNYAGIRPEDPKVYAIYVEKSETP